MAMSTATVARSFGFMAKVRRPVDPDEKQVSGNDKKQVSGNDKKQVNENERKWGKALLKAGYTLIPNVFIQKQAELKLKPTDMAIILNLAYRWWKKGNLPYPSKKLIASEIGVHPTTVRRHLSKLVKLGLITRHEMKTPGRGQDTNQYSFEGIIKQAEPLAASIVAVRNARAEERKTGRRARVPVGDV
jgi:hypothetical protein